MSKRKRQTASEPELVPVSDVDAAKAVLNLAALTIQAQTVTTYEHVLGQRHDIVAMKQALIENTATELAILRTWLKRAITEG